jgi:glyoxylase-like metal-dependent hydrolase (beta-lactamase superfamily II)
VSALDRHDVALVRAPNPGPFTLSGTNTWLVGRDPCWVVDPGPALEPHVEAIVAEASGRGGIGGIALTHWHPDHAEAVGALRERAGEPPVAAARDADLPLGDGDRCGPLTAIPTPGHSADHLAFVAGGAAFTGDAVLGEGSVFIVAQLGRYLDGLRRLHGLGLDVICPGHGPVVEDPAAKLDEYVRHRLDRERLLVAALDAGLRTVDEVLDRAWPDAPAPLRLAAAATLGAHLDKLEEEGRLPDGVERPAIPDWLKTA